MGNVAEAGTSALFPGVDSILIIQGKDSDTSHLFYAMNVAPNDQSGVLEKRIHLTTNSSEPVFDLNCSRATLSGVASCTFKIYRALATIDKERRYIRLSITDSNDVQAIGPLFLHASSGPLLGEVFRSQDKRLRIWKAVDIDGKVSSFSVRYLE